MDFRLVLGQPTNYQLLQQGGLDLAISAIMDVVQAVSGYISRMVATNETAASASSKMKILLLDSETVRTIGTPCLVQINDNCSRYLLCRQLSLNLLFLITRSI